MNNDTIKYYIDLSARNGFPYMLIDPGWAMHVEATGNPQQGIDLTRSFPQIDIPELVAYAKS